MRNIFSLLIISILCSGLMATSDELQPSSSGSSTRAHSVELPTSDDDVAAKFQKPSVSEPDSITAGLIKKSYPGISWTPELISQFMQLIDEASAHPELNEKPYKLSVNKKGNLEINYFN